METLQITGNQSYNSSTGAKVLAPSEMSEIKFSVVVIVTIFTLTTNQLIIYAFFKNFKMRTTTNVLVVNLCTADVIAVLGDLFYYLVELVHDGLFRQFIFCRVSMFINVWSTNAVVMAMTMIAIDRYFNLVHNSLRRWSRKHVRFIVDYVWIYAFVTALPWDLLFSTSPGLALEACDNLPQPYLPAMNTKALSYTLRFTCVIIPYLVIIFIFVLVGLSTRRRQAIHIQGTAIIKPHAQKTERFSVHSYGRSTVSAFLLFSFFLSVTLPFFVTVLSSTITANQKLSNIYEFMIFLSFRLHGILLPIVYLLRNRFIAEFLQRKIPFCSSNFKRRKRNERFAQLPSTNTEIGRPFLISKPNSRLVKQANRIKIFYTAAQLSTEFNDIGSAAGNSYTQQVVIANEVSGVENDVLIGNFESYVHKWVYRPKENLTIVQE